MIFFDLFKIFTLLFLQYLSFLFHKVYVYTLIHFVFYIKLLLLLSKVIKKKKIIVVSFNNLSIISYAIIYCI